MYVYNVAAMRERERERERVQGRESETDLVEDDTRDLGSRVCDCGIVAVIVRHL